MTPSNKDSPFINHISRIKDASPPSWYPHQLWLISIWSVSSSSRTRCHPRIWYMTIHPRLELLEGIFLPSVFSQRQEMRFYIAVLFVFDVYRYLVFQRVRIQRRDNIIKHLCCRWQRLRCPRADVCCVCVTLIMMKEALQMNKQPTIINI